MKILIIQTAFIGDVVLATSVVEKIKKHFPECQIDFLLRKGNESLLTNNPHIANVIIFDKKNEKIKNIFKLAKQIRQYRYDKVINLHRFASSGYIAGRSKAKERIGFNKNPMSFMYTHKINHIIDFKGKGTHEIERNLKLIEHFTNDKFEKPRLYPSEADFEKVKHFDKYICMAPASVWFTKQYPKQNWAKLIKALSDKYTICLLGGPGDIDLCKEIKNNSGSDNVEILAGSLSFLESAALMKEAAMNFVNDSAPLHFASAVDAPVAALFCSTIPAFGFTPVSDESIVIETHHDLDCRPCGLHGKKECPKGHFKCGDIAIDDIIERCGL